MCIPYTGTIREAIACIERGGQGIALVVDGERKLFGTITDGDVRRALLAGMELETPVSILLENKVTSTQPYPVTAPVGADSNRLLEIMRESAVRHLPLLDLSERVVDLAVQDDLLQKDSMKLEAVIMAGGFGRRLFPLTEELPKPMLPVGGRPLMERIIERMKSAGIRQVNVMTHFKSEKIEEHFGNGDAFGVTIRYVREDQPLGTGGALGLMRPSQETLLVVNGDILTQLDFRAMLAFHKETRADMTVAICKYGFQIPYGVIECAGWQITKLSEKPRTNVFINSGIYLLEPSAYSYLPSGIRFDMPDLIQRLLDAGRPVSGFPIHEYWIDIGAHEDYARAVQDVQEGRVG